MLKKDMQGSFIIQNRLGIHLRVAHLIAETASKFSSDIWLSKDGLEVDAKSIMGITLLTASCGSKVIIKARGVDASEAIKELGRLIDSKFGED